MNTEELTNINEKVYKCLDIIKIMLEHETLVTVQRT